MKEYDFSKGKRGVARRKPEPTLPGKKMITIRLDADIIDHFLACADQQGIGYQTLINQALREQIHPKVAVDEVRLIVREELRKQLSHRV